MPVGNEKGAYSKHTQPRSRSGCCTPTSLKTRMGSQETVDVGRWRKIVELGSGRTGNVALYIEPASLPANPSEEDICLESKHDVLHAVKRVHRQCMANSGAVRRILQEKKALEALRGVSEVTVASNATRNLFRDCVTVCHPIFWRRQSTRLVLYQ